VRVDRKPLVELPHEPLLLGIDVGRCRPADPAVVPEEIDDTEIADRGHGETRDAFERRIVIEGGGEDPARFGEERGSALG
jgi:hypothetical protein